MSDAHDDGVLPLQDACTGPTTDYCYGKRWPDTLAVLKTIRVAQLVEETGFSAARSTPSSTAQSHIRRTGRSTKRLLDDRGSQRCSARTTAVESPPLMIPWFAAVSFAKVPLNEIGEKANAILQSGWTGEVTRRGDPWVQVVAKSFPGSEKDPEAELRAIMGEYWLAPEGIRQYLDP